LRTFVFLSDCQIVTLDIVIFFSGFLDFGLQLLDTDFHKSLSKEIVFLTKSTDSFGDQETRSIFLECQVAIFGVILEIDIFVSFVVNFRKNRFNNMGAEEIFHMVVDRRNLIYQVFL